MAKQTTTSEFLVHYKQAKKQIEIPEGIDDLNKEVERIMKGNGPNSPLPRDSSKTARLVHALASGKYSKNQKMKKQLSLVVAQQVKSGGGKDLPYLFSQDPQLESILSDADKLLKQYDISLLSPSNSRRDKSG